MADDTKKNFLGIPIEGDITRGQRKTEQKPLEELSPLLQAAIVHPDIHVFGWNQYTPYFNDGDPCIFSVHELWATPVNAAEDDDAYHDGVEYDKRWGERSYRWEGPEYIYGPYSGNYESAYLTLLDLNKAIQSGAFDDVLLDAFGDHAEITVEIDKIVVSFFEHD